MGREEEKNNKFILIKYTYFDFVENKIKYYVVGIIPNVYVSIIKSRKNPWMLQGGKIL